MKKVIGKALLATAVVFLTVPSISVAKDIMIVGTGSGSSILRAIGNEFTKINPDISIIVPKSIGSGGGIRAVEQDKYTLGRVAVKLQEKNIKKGLKYLSFAKMPIVFFVNNSVSIKDLTNKQICDLYEGNIKAWKKIDKNAKGRVRIIRREEGDSSLNVLLESLSGFKDIVITKKSKITFSDPSTVDTAIGQKGAIAFGTWPNTKNKDGITVLKINGISATNDAYPCTGELALIYKEKNFSGNLKKFIKFLSTPNARKAIVEAGGLPTN